MNVERSSDVEGFSLGEQSGRFGGDRPLGAGGFVVSVNRAGQCRFSLSKRSLASLILAARYGDPPARRGTNTGLIAGSLLQLSTRVQTPPIQLCAYEHLKNHISM